MSNRHWSVKEKAQDLRKKGLSYSEILKEIKVSKASISLWCSQIRLTQTQLARLRGKRGDYLVGIKRIQNKFQFDRDCEFIKGKKLFDKLNDDSDFVAGLMLYWAEGTKTKGVAVANSDPELMRFMVSWFKKYFNIEPEDFRIHLHLHSGQSEPALVNYWCKLLGVKRGQFYKSFVKPEGSGYRKNKLYNGTVRLRVNGQGSTLLLFQIMGAISGFIQKMTGKQEDLGKWVGKLQYAD